MKRYGQAKNEVLANIPEIKSLLNKGLTRGYIFQTLKEQGSISCCRAIFYRIISKQINLTSIADFTPKIDSIEKSSIFVLPESSKADSVVHKSEPSKDDSQIDIENYFRENPKEEKAEVSEEDAAVSSDVPNISKFAPKNTNPHLSQEFVFKPDEIDAEDFEREWCS